MDGNLVLLNPNLKDIKNEIRECADLERIPLTDEEVILIEKLAYLLVEIDNYEARNYPDNRDLTYGYQNGLINLARDHNGQFGI